MAGWLLPIFAPALVTLPSSRSALSATMRLRSVPPRDMLTPYCLTAWRRRRHPMVNEEEAASHVLVAPLLPYGKPLYRAARSALGLAAVTGGTSLLTWAAGWPAGPAGRRALTEDVDIDLNLLLALGALLEDRNLTRAGERI